MLLRRSLLAACVVLVVAFSGCTEVAGKWGELQNDRTPPGRAARDYLTNAKYTKMVVEIDYPAGSAPNAEALQRLEAALREVTPKTSITIDSKSGLTSFPARGENGKYSFDEIIAIEKANRNRYSSGDTAVLYILYLDGGSTADNGNSKVLGAAYRGSSLVMFKGNIKSTTRSDGGLLPSFQATESCLERAVLVHELGHALGLVNNGIDMTKAREDPNSPGHSTNKRSVMYHAVENAASLTNVFSGGCSEIPYQFDADDKADMKAVRDGR